MLRSDLQTEEARNIMRKYKGQTLFPFDNEGEGLVEYLLTMQIHKEKNQYASLMVQISPFLYELFLVYAKKNLKIPIFHYQEKNGGRKVLKRESLLKMPQGRELVDYLDRVWMKPFRESDLSFFLLYQIFCFAAEHGDTINPKLHHEFMTDPLMDDRNDCINKLRMLRNSTAHEIVNVTEKTISMQTGMASNDILNSFWHLLTLVYGDTVNRQRMTYKRLNKWIEEALMENTLS